MRDIAARDQLGIQLRRALDQPDVIGDLVVFQHLAELVKARTQILFGRHDKRIIGVLQLATLLILLAVGQLSGLGSSYYWSLLAAVWLDGGFDAVRVVFDTAWKDELSAPPQKSLTNPKSALQEWALGQGRPLPTYRVADRTGSDHAPTFTVEVCVQDVQPLTAQGRSRQEAEKAAATALLKREGVI